LGPNEEVKKLESKFDKLADSVISLVETVKGQRDDARIAQENTDAKFMALLTAIKR
jgi:hypothetical protein